MSTRAYIKVKGVNAGLYRHSDGYPDSQHGVLATLVPFLSRFVDERGNDEQYCLARLIQDQCNRNRPNEVIGFGVYPNFTPKNIFEKTDCEYYYEINLNKRTVTVVSHEGTEKHAF